MKKLLPFILVLLFILSSCGGAIASANPTRTVIDALGRHVDLNKNLSRIIIAGKQSPMLIDFLYLFKTANQKVIALEKRNQTNDNFMKLIDENINDKYLLEKGASAEQISPFKPDLVIMKSSMRDSIGKQMEDLSIPILYVEFENVEQIYRDLRILAEALDEKNRGEELVNKYQEIINHIKEKVDLNTGIKKPTVLILQAMSSDQDYVFSVPVADWLQTNLTEEAGGVPIWKDANQSGGWSDINMEQIVSWNPDEIFVVNYQGEASEIVAQLKNDSIWQNLKAVKNEKLYAFPYDYQSWDQPDPRWILGYSWLALKLNPENIKADEIQELITNFYNEFYSLSDDTIREEINPRIADYLK